LLVAQLKQLAKRAAIALGLVAVVLLFVLNGLVRLCGGEPHLLSPRFVAEKVRALGLLAAHAPAHLFGACDGDKKRIIERAAKKHGLPADYVLRIARAESRLGPHRISHAGAMGLMQLSPDRALDLGVDDPYAIEENVDAAVSHLAWLWKRYGGDKKRVTAAYNAGPGAVPKRGPLTLPGETKLYLERVLGS
jgi:soluble lytic murein transglycosylase-like protein